MRLVTLPTGSVSGANRIRGGLARSVGFGVGVGGGLGAGAPLAVEGGVVAAMACHRPSSGVESPGST